MGSVLGPVLANIIMVEFERVTIKKLIDDGYIKFYGRYVDDTLLLIKKEHMPYIYESFHKFDPNIRFTDDTFENENPHFLDIEISTSGLSIYRKDTFTGQYVNYNSYVPWRYKSSWINSLAFRAKNICSHGLLYLELGKIKDIISWNGFPKRIGNKIISKIVNTPQTIHPEQSVEYTKIWFNLPYMGKKGEGIVKRCINKLKRCMVAENNIRFAVIYQSTKLSFFTNMKDKLPLMDNSFVVYEFTCPYCRCNYVGKTERTLLDRVIEHAYKDKDSFVGDHLCSCVHANYFINLLSIDLNHKSNIKIIPKELKLNIVRNNIKIIDRAKRWDELLVKEALAIKSKNPTLNKGLKASHQLHLF